MKEIIAKLLEYRKRNTTILIILLVIVLIVLLFLNGTIQSPFNSKKDQKDQMSEYEKSLLEQAETALKNNKLEVAKNVPSDKIAVKIATLSSDDYDGVITGTKAGCDIVRMIYRYIEPTPAILNATIKELLAYKQEFDYLPGNFVAKQEKLNFEKATLDNGVAKIYLNGEVAYAGACDNPRLEIQITETAKQFETVKSVEIYLNGKLYETPSEK